MAFCSVVLYSRPEPPDVRHGVASVRQGRSGGSVATDLWLNFLKGHLEAWVGWVRGSAPDAVLWHRSSVLHVATCLAKVVVAGGVRDRSVIASAGLECWRHLQGIPELPQPSKLILQDWFHRILVFLCRRGFISLDERLVAFGGITTCHHRVRRTHVAAKLAHLTRYYVDFPRMEAPAMAASRYEQQNALSKGSLNKWRRCAIRDRWHLWTEEDRRRHAFAPQHVRDLHGLPRLGRRFEDYYPERVVSRVEAYMQKGLDPGPGGAKRNVKVGDLRQTLGSLVQEENAKLKRIYEHRCGRGLQGKGQCPQYRGTGSVRAAMRIRRKLGLVNNATKASKQELTPDSPEMRKFVAQVQQELEATVPELLGNMDEMWRRQMRDDRLKSLHHSRTHSIDTAEAKPSVRVEEQQRSSATPRARALGSGAQARVIVEADYGSWIGPHRVNSIQDKVPLLSKKTICFHANGPPPWGGEPLAVHANGPPPWGGEPLAAVIGALAVIFQSRIEPCPFLKRCINGSEGEGGVWARLVNKTLSFYPPPRSDPLCSTPPHPAFSRCYSSQTHIRQVHGAQVLRIAKATKLPRCLCGRGKLRIRSSTSGSVESTVAPLCGGGVATVRRRGHRRFVTASRLHQEGVTGRAKP